MTTLQKKYAELESLEKQLKLAINVTLELQAKITSIEEELESFYTESFTD